MRVREKKNVKVSVIIPTFKRPYLLGRCLLNLSRQKFDAEWYEVICITDGPDGETRRVVNELRESLKFDFQCWSLPQKDGPAAARNFGWRQAKGELIIFTDDDCLPEEDFISSYWEAYVRSGNDCVVFTGKVIVPLSQPPTDYEKNIAQLETAEFVTANCACAKRCLQKVGGFDEQFRAAWREDSELQFKFISHHIPIIQIEQARVVHPVRTARWGISLSEQKKSMYNVLLYKKYPTLFREKIFKGPHWSYYVIDVLLLSAFASVFFQEMFLTVGLTACWLLMVSLFIRKRLDHTSKSIRHVTEMIFTSLFIPILSVFWTLYGALRFRTWFL
jgi:glycosyltransferase involved in cell wall biosynthesis